MQISTFCSRSLKFSPMIKFLTSECRFAGGSVVVHFGVLSSGKTGSLSALKDKRLKCAHLSRSKSAKMSKVAGICWAKSSNSLAVMSLRAAKVARCPAGPVRSLVSCGTGRPSWAWSSRTSALSETASFVMLAQVV